MKNMLAIKFYPLDHDELWSYTNQDYFWLRSSHLNYFGEPYIPPLREVLCAAQHIFLKENIEIYEEVHENIIIEEEPKIKIVEKINEDPIIEKDLEVEIIETIKEEIIKEVVNDIDEVKLDDCNVQAPFIFVVRDIPKFINFIRVERFDSIVNSYLVNLYNYMKTKEKEIPIYLFFPLMSCKYRKKIKWLKHLKHLFIWSRRFQIS